MTPVEIAIGQSSYDWWDLVPAIVGGVLGALAGGIPAWFLANRSSKETLNRDRVARQESELSSVFRLHTKLGMMVNDLSGTLIQLREMLKRPFDPNDKCPTQRRVSAFAGRHYRPEASFTPDDLAIFVAAEEFNYLTELDLFGRRYMADMDALDTYGTLKAELHDLLSDSEDIQFGPGDVVMTRPDGRNANKLRMKARTLESLIVPLIRMMERDLHDGLRLACDFDVKLKPLFPGRKVPGFFFEDLRNELPDFASQLPDRNLAKEGDRI